MFWLSALNAHAGTYIWTTRDAQGNITAQSPVYSGGTWYGQGYMGPGPSSFGPVTTSNGPGWSGGGGGVAGASASGTITATFTWQPANANDPPPAQVFVVEASSASASALSSFGYPNPVPTALCDDGIGPKAVTTTTYYPLNSTDPSYSVTTGSCQDAKKYFMTGKPTMTFTCTVKANANGNQAACSASASYSVSVGADSRAVTISCPSIETSYYKSEDGDSGAPIQLAHQRSSDGSMITDSAVSPPLTQPGGGTTWTASPTLQAQAAGFQNPLFSWSASGSGSLTTSGNSAHTILSVSFPLSTSSKSLGKQSTVNVNATDSDGGTKANTYTITWHYPYENWQTQGSAFQNAPKAYHSTDGPQGANGQVHIPVTSAGIDWSIPSKIGGGFLTTGATVIGVAAPETSPLVLGFLSATGYSLSVVNPPPPPTIYSQQGTLGQFQSDISTELAIASGSTSGVFLPTVARMDPNFARNAVRKASSYFNGPGGTLSFDATAYRVQWQQNYTGDSYDMHGYAGPASGLVHYEGAWNYVFNWNWAVAVSPGH